MASLPDQKDKFEQEFQKIINASSQAIRDSWNGLYQWLDMPGNVPSQPKVDETVKKLAREQKDKYVTLLNKFKNGRL